ncbi:MAG: hypothetical protein DI549_06300 [Ancylobacter novellus]|uniref:Uncharacterized protein n=1 Tax=Ancylobacter novellus TaxID=921 RepID=A0A2W5R263_ANCNO|nr:MAG: hypothetical protein DI549_06300 [Ancylobacter novellus]
MKTLFLALAVLLVGTALARADDTRLDLSHVERVEISGDAASVRLTARPGGPFQARLVERRSGWLEGAVLRVEARTPSMFEASDCVVELTADLPPDVSVRIDLAAVQARLDGAFAAFDTQARAGDISVVGTVERVDLRGAALRAQLDLGEAAPPAPRAVNLAVGSLDAEVTLPARATVGWQVDAKAALVDTARANDRDGATQIRVSADFLRLSIH